MAVLDNIRFATDLVLATPNALGLRNFVVTLTSIVEAGASRPGFGGTKTTTQTVVQNLGTVNVRLREVSTKDIFMSGGLLQDKDVVIGPIVYPYDTGTVTGGTAFSIWEPPVSADATQLFIKITGEGLYPSGSFFKKIHADTSKNITYKIYLRNTGIQP